MHTHGYAAHSADTELVPYTFDRRELRANDVAIDITHCGVCHSDLHAARNHWGGSSYPIVPGHEIVGLVSAVGADVTRHKVGDMVAVGCMVDACMTCDRCEKGIEQFCSNGWTGTYSSVDRIDGTPTHGGYSKAIVVRQEFVCKVPDGLDPAHAAPLMCAGITVYSPLRTWNVGPGSRVGVAGLGGLGHMAVKLAAAMGAHVTVISRSEDKRQDALAQGAHAYIATSDKEAMKQATASLDLIIDTVPVEHSLEPYFPLLDIDGTLVIVGQIGPLGQISSYSLIFGRRRVSASLIGGIAETQEMLELCAEKNVVPEIEMIRMDEINHAFDRLERADVRYRFVIDLATLAPA